MSAAPDARRRLILLLLSRGEIGSAARAADARREPLDEPPERGVAVHGEAGAAGRLEGGEAVHRAA